MRSLQMQNKRKRDDVPCLPSEGWCTQKNIWTGSKWLGTPSLRKFASVGFLNVSRHVFSYFPCRQFGYLGCTWKTKWQWSLWRALTILKRKASVKSAVFVRIRLAVQLNAQILDAPSDGIPCVAWRLGGTWGSQWRMTESLLLVGQPFVLITQGQPDKIAQSMRVIMIQISKQQIRTNRLKRRRIPKNSMFAPAWFPGMVLHLWSSVIRAKSGIMGLVLGFKKQTLLKWTHLYAPGANPFQTSLKRRGLKRDQIEFQMVRKCRMSLQRNLQYLRNLKIMMKELMALISPLNLWTAPAEIHVEKMIRKMMKEEISINR